MVEKLKTKEKFLRGFLERYKNTIFMYLSNIFKTNEKFVKIPKKPETDMFKHKK